jgi:hypothetical protein
MEGIAKILVGVLKVSTLRQLKNEIASFSNSKCRANASSIYYIAGYTSNTTSNTAAYTPNLM